MDGTTGSAISWIRLRGSIAMSDRDKGTVEDETTNTVVGGMGVRELPDQIIDVLVKRAMQAEQSASDPEEAEALALLDGFDGRIANIERRVDRVLARLDAG